MHWTSQLQKLVAYTIQTWHFSHCFMVELFKNTEKVKEFYSVDWNSSTFNLKINILQHLIYRIFILLFILVFFTLLHPFLNIHFVRSSTFCCFYSLHSMTFAFWHISPSTYTLSSLLLMHFQVNCRH
jgi:hypothetical protein